MTQIKSQLLGLLLGLSTAVGCIFYEKLVKHFSILGIGIIKLIEISIFILVVFTYTPSAELIKDYNTIQSTPKLYWIAGIFILTGITNILWYTITKNQGVMVSSIYEVKYIAMLALLYIVFGDNKFTLNTGIGVGLAMISIYFISKS